MRRYLLLALSLFVAGGCSPISPELVQALAKDNASFCAMGDIRGGAGAISMPAPGGYGQGTLAFCRSNRANARLTVLPDGSISIEHGTSE
jgi:L-aminopeptidase/D-esterase-like protein